MQDKMKLGLACTCISNESARHLHCCQVAALLLHELAGHVLNGAVQLLLLQQAA